jgi:preprotein translocase subunit SecD
MMVHRERFNIYLMAGLAAIMAFGCQSPEKKKKKELATLHLYIETSPRGIEQTQVASILREAPFDVTVRKTPFLTEASVAEAKVIEAMGGYAISLQFNNEGKLLLEQYTSANPGKKIAVFCQFGKDLAQHRWVAAPAISRRIANGLFVFTPDASREEAEEIVLGLNNVSKKLRGNWMHDQ